MSRLAAFLFLALNGALIGAAGCSDCRTDRDKTAATSSASSPPEVALRLPPSPEPLSWRPQDDARGVGVPAGCRLKLPIRHAKLPPRAVRFAAARSDLERLALALATPGNPNTSHSGLIDLASPKARALPWVELDRPPVFDRTANGWVAAFTRPLDHGKKTALLWSEHSPLQPLSSGDQLAVADLFCTSAACAVLTTLPRAVAASGAALHIGGPDLATTRVEIEADPDVAWQPLAITSFDGAEARVALKAPAAVALWSVAAGRAAKLRQVATEFGVYDVLAAKNTLIVAPGSGPDEPCKAEFPIRVIGDGGKVSVVRSQAAPESLLIRPLARGALMLWVGPISCADSARTLVYAALLDREGAQVGSVMSVADAAGFAAATSGDELALWLRTAEGLSYVRAECERE